MPSLNTPVQRLKVAVLPLDLLCSGPVTEGSSPTTGLTLLWAGNPFRGNFNHWQVARKEAGQIFFNLLAPEFYI